MHIQSQAVSPQAVSRSKQTANPEGHVAQQAQSSAAEAAVDSGGKISGDQLALTLPRPAELPALELSELADLSVGQAVGREQRLKIFFGSSERAEHLAWARQQLALDTEPAPAPEQRQANFERFAERFFPALSDDPFDLTYPGPQPGMRTYDTLRTYALTDYGAAMLQKVLREAGEQDFAIKIIEDSAPQGWDDFVIFPPDFPGDNPQFKISGCWDRTLPCCPAILDWGHRHRPRRFCPGGWQPWA